MGIESMGSESCRHVEHFSCAKCEKPFLGGRYFEKGPYSNDVYTIFGILDPLPLVCILA